MGRRLTTVAAAWMALTGSASAAPAELLSGRDHLDVPALAGDRVVVSEATSRGPRALAVGPTGRTSSLHSGRPGETLHLAARPGGVLARVTGRDGVAWRLFAGALDGPFHVRDACGTPAPPPASGGVVDVWADAGCVDDRVRVQWPGGQQDVQASGSVVAVAAGGRYAAWIEARRPDALLRIYDTDSPGVIRNFTLDALTNNLDVQDDGTAVVATLAGSSGAAPVSCGRGVLVPRFSIHPLDGPSREVPLRSCSASVRIGGDRIAFVERTAAGDDVISLVSLDGTSVQAIAGAESFPPFPRFDWDGRRLAWTTTRCRDHALLVSDPADGGRAATSTRCPIAVGRPRVGSDGRLHVRIRCPRGCVSDPGLTVISPRWLHFGSRGRPMPYARFDLRPGRATTLRLPLTLHQRRLIRRRGRVEVRLKALGLNLYRPRIARTIRSR